MEKIFKLEGLDCAYCASKIEKAVSKLDGVNEATVNFMTAKMKINGEAEKMPLIIEEAEKLCKKIESGIKLKKA